MGVDLEHFRKLERMYHSAPINAYFQPRLQVREAEAEIEITVRPEFFHAAGAVHGSVYFKALDDAAFFAANSLVTDVFVLTVAYNLYLVRPVSRGVLLARGHVVHHSRRLLIAEATMVDSESQEIARGSGAFMRSSIALSPEIGYI